MKPHRIHRQAGVALLEALIAILLFSFGLLGIIGLQAKAQQFSVDSEDRTRAALFANELSSLMWMQKSADVAAADVAAWQGRIAASGSGLTNGDGSYSFDSATKLATIIITWKTPWKKAAEQSSTYTTQVLIPTQVVTP